MPMGKRKATKKKSKDLFCTEMNFVVLGSCSSGKTSLVRRFLSGSFSDSYKPTTMDVFEEYYLFKSMNVAVTYRIFDITGSDDFPAMRQMAINSGQTFVIVYAVNDRNSFEDAKKVRSEIIGEKGSDDLSILLVGNKCDLKDEDRVVSPEEGRALAQNWGCTFAETSAKVSINTNNVFTEPAIRILKNKYPGLGVEV